MNGDDDSLLLAQAVPVPDYDTESDGDVSVNLISFSAPFEMYPPPAALKSTSQVHSSSPKSNKDFKRPLQIASALSSDSITDMSSDQPIVEDALRARAEQAESAAERLLELVDSEGEGIHHSTIPASLLVGSNNGNGHGNGTPKIKSKPAPIPLVQQTAPVTPVNRAAAIMRQAAMFKDSPAYNGRSSTSLMDVLQGRKNETGWWLKRQTRRFWLPYLR